MHPIHGGNLVWAAMLAGCSPQEILDFSASINPWGPPPSAIAAIQSHLSRLHTYPDPGYRELRVALAQAHHLDPDWILPGNGSAELLTWAGRELAMLAATWVLAPAFGDYQRALSAFGAQLQPVPLVSLDQGWTLATLRSRSFPPGCGLLLNNPHNPTGQLFPREEVLPLLAEFDLVVVDEAFMDFLPPDRQQSLVDQVSAATNLVILRSLTKFYSLPGLRLGYAIADPQRLQRWQQWRDPWPVNELAAAAGVAVVQDTDFQQQTWRWLAAARPALFQGLAALPGLTPYPGAANFLLVRSAVSTLILQQQLLQHHRILIRDCLSFPELGDRYFRVAIRTPAENQQLLTALANILGG
ncbi:threonine-phosphate decarboxylase [Neosynechococcus sphagnicola sy1]|uniref:threonine-phosphate decarboxylase n=1 Tax=Neosynechococcus sphagnicola sy1 TaxID=1497020 RepID=A0A098THA5_9CYAN|nr:threonine-phosphate decarboxylase [Neosynechococcus sphagnicola sy1]